MRRVFVLGFFIIVLILITGCTSTQNADSTVSKSQYPMPGYTAVETNSKNSLTSIINCNQPPLDPAQFQKFLPEIPGWTRSFGQNISPGTNYVLNYKLTDQGYANFISDTYQISDKSNINIVQVAFEDLGPCAGDFGLNRNYLSVGQKDATQSKINFHGYPAIHAKMNGTGLIYDIVNIGVNNRLFVTITASGPQREYSFSKAEADIEKFANAIDFKGFAASV